MNAFEVAQYIAQFAENEEVKNELKKFGVGIVPNSLSQLVGKLQGAGYVVMTNEEFNSQYVQKTYMEQSLEALQQQLNLSNEINQQVAQQPVFPNFNQGWQVANQPNFEPTFNQPVNNFGTHTFNEPIQEKEEVHSKEEEKTLVDPFSDNTLITIAGDKKDINFKDFGQMPNLEGETLPFENIGQQIKENKVDPFSSYPTENTFGLSNQQEGTLTKPDFLQNQSNEFKHVSPEKTPKNEIEAMWKEFLEKATLKEPISFMSLILNAEAVSFENNVLQLGYNSTQTYQMKQIKSRIEKLKELFKNEMNKEIEFKFDLKENL